MIKVNEGKTDRLIRVFVGIVALMLGLFILSGTLKVIVIIIGIIAMITGVIGFCGLYSLLGINTNQLKK